MGLHFVYQGLVIMTPQELLTLIQSDAQATTLANAGNDFGCAARCMAIASNVRVPTVLTERGFYKALGALQAETILQKLKAYSLAGEQYSLPVARFLCWLEPANDGADFGDVELLGVASILTQGGWLTQPELEAFGSVSLVSPTITANDVSLALRGQ
jgi:hypothetical protein